MKILKLFYYFYFTHMLYWGTLVIVQMNFRSLNALKTDILRHWSAKSLSDLEVDVYAMSLLVNEIGLERHIGPLTKG